MAPPKAAAKAPPMPSETAVKQARGKLMRKKSDNMFNAGEARKKSVDLRADWAKAAGVKVGKGRGKGKKGKGKGKGSKYVVKQTDEEKEAARKAAVEKLEKRQEKKQRDSIKEMVKIDKMLAPKKPRWKKVGKIQPEQKALNLQLKCVKCTPVAGDDKAWEAVLGDDTGVVTFSLRNKDHADACQPGASIRVQNAKVLMVKNFIRVVVDKWAILKTADAPYEYEAKTDTDVSATEYELA